MPTVSMIDGVRITSPDRVYFTAAQAGGVTLTKADLIAYYYTVRELIEPHVVGRPVMLLRCPEGLSGACFYQKHPAPGMPPEIARARLADRSGSSEYIAFDSFRSIVAAVGIGALELHIWASRVDRPDRPDRMVFDLDPGEDVRFSWVKEAALELGEYLEEAGLTSFVMTTGGKGLHLVVPLVRRHEFGEVRDYARAWARRLAHERPDRYIDHPSKARRNGHIYIDVLRNGRGATAICPLSTRARSGARVAAPIDWEALDTDFGPEDWTLANLVGELSRTGRNPWAGYFETRQQITREAWAAV